jgi:hypothetical protein
MAEGAFYWVIRTPTPFGAVPSCKVFDTIVAASTDAY